MLSVPILEEMGYKTTPQGEVIVFKRNTGVCRHMPYIDLREHAEDLVILETVQKNMGMFTKKEIKRAKLARVVQRRMDHPTDEHMKNIVLLLFLTNLQYNHNVGHSNTITVPACAVFWLGRAALARQASSERTRKCPKALDVCLKLADVSAANPY